MSSWLPAEIMLKDKEWMPLTCPNNATYNAPYDPLFIHKLKDSQDLFNRKIKWNKSINQIGFCKKNFKMWNFQDKQLLVHDLCYSVAKIVWFLKHFTTLVNTLKSRSEKGSMFSSRVHAVLTDCPIWGSCHDRSPRQSEVGSSFRIHVKRVFTSSPLLRTEDTSSWPIGWEYTPTQPAISILSVSLQS